MNLPNGIYEFELLWWHKVSSPTWLGDVGSNDSETYDLNDDMILERNDSIDLITMIIITYSTDNPKQSFESPVFNTSQFVFLFARYAMKP